jgi:hypothetical protein
MLELPSLSPPHVLLCLLASLVLHPHPQGAYLLREIEGLGEDGLLSLRAETLQCLPQQVSGARPDSEGGAPQPGELAELAALRQGAGLPPWTAGQVRGEPHRRLPCLAALDAPELCARHPSASSPLPPPAGRQAAVAAPPGNAVASQAGQVSWQALLLSCCSSLLAALPRRLLSTTLSCRGPCRAQPGDQRALPPAEQQQLAAGLQDAEGLSGGFLGSVHLEETPAKPQPPAAGQQERAPGVQPAF